MAVQVDKRVDFFGVLESATRSPEIPETADVYGWLCGSWDLDVLHYGVDVRAWNNPVGGHYEEQVGRWNGRDILQEGTRPDGAKTRWTFTEITADSFHSRGEALYPGKEAWTLEGEFVAQRRRT